MRRPESGKRGERCQNLLIGSGNQGAIGVAPIEHLTAPLVHHQGADPRTLQRAIGECGIEPPFEPRFLRRRRRRRHELRDTRDGGESQGATTEAKFHRQTTPHAAQVQRQRDPRVRGRSLDESEIILEAACRQLESAIGAVSGVGTAARDRFGLAQNGSEWLEVGASQS